MFGKRMGGVRKVEGGGRLGGGVETLTGYAGRGVGYLTRRRCPIRRVLLRSMPFSWQMRVMVVP